MVLSPSKRLKVGLILFPKLINFVVIMATNRIDTLDSALLRPGRIDRKIEFSASNEYVRSRTQIKN